MINKQTKGVEPSAAVQAAVKKLIAEVGEEAASVRAEMSAQTLARLAAGLSVNRSTLGMIRSRLGIVEA
jgi:hypothetical protein